MIEGQRLLVANRGEVALRVLRAAHDLGLEAVALASRDDGDGPWLDRAASHVLLDGSGPPAYLDVDAVVDAARRTGCTLVHPGIGLLSESPALAEACATAGLTFVGPDAAALEVLGDKVAARGLAASVDVPVLRASDGPVDAEGAAELLASWGDGAAAVIKAVHGGGGRGMRVVHGPTEVAAAHERASSEAAVAFGSAEVYVEELVVDARHVEVQVVGDGHAAVHLGERDCSLQRRHQKLVELAPSPDLDPALRRRVCDAALRIATPLSYRGLLTVEFLVRAVEAAPHPWVFIEANPRLQVEHTVTEVVHGIDLVVTQLRLALGASLAEVGLTDPPPARGLALQARVNAETISADGALRPSAGRIEALTLPSGPGIRVDTAARAGAPHNPRFDPLLAKVVVHAPDGSLATARARAERALAELEVSGVATNATFLRALLRRPEVTSGASTELVDRLAPELATEAAAASTRPAAQPDAPDDGPAARAPLAGVVSAVAVAAGDAVAAGQEIVVVEAMKMEHGVTTTTGGTVRDVLVAVGDAVEEGQILVTLVPTTAADDAAAGEAGGEAGAEAEVAPVDLDQPRADLAASLERHALGLDEHRPEAVARRHDRGHRTARENVADLCDPGSFTEIGPLLVAAQRRRRDIDDLIRRTPADGLVAGFGDVNGDCFPGPDARCVVLAYDYTVLAGTQGFLNHRKKDRLFELAERWRLPVVFFTEGGGGRPGDTDAPGVAGLDTMAFHLFGRLSGRVPLVGIANGRCFAGNAALLGCCDVVIATEGSSIGMGGPAMIEGGGLGTVDPDDVGPLATQVANGVVDVAVADEAEATAVARRYLAYFQGSVDDWEVPDQRRLRHVVPERRTRAYDVRAVLDLLFDTGSVLELRRGFAAGMLTALARVEGRAVGVVANEPAHLAGAITSDGADKAARFLQLCDAFGLPVVSLCDTPGIMVGVDAERSGTVRHASRLFVTGASLSVPVVTVVLRKAYGLGAQAMAAGSFGAATHILSWPSGEFGGMGLEGAVQLGFRKELEAIADPTERRAAFEAMVAAAYQHGSALNTASHFEIDDVIDPADTRRWILSAVAAADARRSAERRWPGRPQVDTW